jgi:alpha-tubulin suppressor-like RCC1 family protein
MSNPNSLLNQSNPENIVTAPKGSIFSREAEEFFLFKNGSSEQLSVSKKTFAIQYKNEIWYPTLKEDTITFATAGETWVKTGSGNTKTGWKQLSNTKSMFSREYTGIILGQIYKIASGYYYSLFLTRNGNLWGTGENWAGQLGLGHDDSPISSSFITSSVANIFAGGNHSLFIDKSGSLWGMGRNNDGQLGNGNTSDQHSPILISTNVISADGGDSHTAYVKSDGTLWAAGANWSGQLGDDTDNQRDTFEQVISGSNVTKVVCGYEHTLFLKSNGELYGVGDGESGQFGNGRDDDFYTPVLIETGVSDIASGEYHTVYLKSGSAYAMGANWDGQLGIGSDDSYIYTSSLVASSAYKIFATEYNTFVIKNDKTLWGAGDNNDGQLGLFNHGDEIHTLQNLGIPSVDYVAGGEGHSLFLKTNNQLFGAGENNDYELGKFDYQRVMYSTDGINWTKGNDALPNSVAYGVTYGDNKFVAVGGEGYGMSSTDGITWNSHSYDISVGRYTDVAYGNGTFVAVNDENNLNEKVATSTDGATWTPRTASLNSDFYSVAYGSSSFVAVGYNGAIMRSTDNGANWETKTSSIDNSWVSVTYGDGKFVAVAEYPTDQNNWRNTFEQIYPESGSVGSASYVSAGARQTLFIKTDDTLWGMGYNGNGELGQGQYNNIIPRPVLIATGSEHADGSLRCSFYVNKSDKSLWGMGYNDHGEFGTSLPKYATTYTPIMVETGSIEQVICATYHRLVIKTDGTLWGVGQNYSGQLGTGDYNERTSSVQIATNVVSASVGDSHTAYIDTTGSLWVTGDNGNGQLGTGDYSYYTTPTQIDTDVVSVHCGEANTMYLKSDGTVWATGLNNYGQLGIATSSYRINTPAQVASGAVSIEAGGYTSFYIDSTGSLWATGDNEYGQLGNGTYDDTNSFIQVTTNVEHVTAPTIDGHFTFIIKTDGSLWGAGDNIDGQLGDGRKLYMVAISEDDGETWTNVQTDQFPWMSIAYGNNKFVAVGNDGYTMSSTDGYSWNIPNRVTTRKDWESVTYGNGKYVAVSSDGESHDVMYSTDGNSWTTGSLTSTSAYWSDVAYGGGKFAAVSYDRNSDIIPPREITLP